jgi:hypothetical protein
MGIEAIFDAPRSGRPWEISPLGTGRDWATGLLCSCGHRFAHDTLDDTVFGANSCRARHCPEDCAFDRLFDFAFGFFAASSFAVLEDSVILNDEFRERAARILWLYERVDWLIEHGGLAHWAW